MLVRGREEGEDGRVGEGVNLRKGEGGIEVGEGGSL